MSGLFGARSRSPCIKVMWSCGHVYCRRCIAESLKRYSMCPFCSCTLYSNGVVGLSKLPDEEKSDSFRGYYALSVKCSECRWKGEMSQIKTHSNPITNEHCGTGGLSRIINMDEKTGCKADNVVQWLDECKPGNISRFMWLKHQILNPGAIATNHMFNAGMQHHSIVVEFENVPHSKMPPTKCQLTYNRKRYDGTPINNTTLYLQMETVSDHNAVLWQVSRDFPQSKYIERIEE
eukprot:GHVO01039616.1.p1 GENE.GHVO01039616.1~~GHVO01039616.1.p1  ORF type:complete len:234 (+),score=12.51 GHVO01039616.1:704-1405(+)